MLPKNQKMMKAHTNREKRGKKEIFRILPIGIHLQLKEEQTIAKTRQVRIQLRRSSRRTYRVSHFLFLLKGELIPNIYFSSYSVKIK